MNYFAQVTDSALRRIYKFVLKRLIGKYLREELVLEQLVVNSRKGTIEIDLLNFDVDILNEEYFSAFPLKLVELSVSNINVSLSYLNILSESCVITVDQIRLTLTDNSESVRPASPQRRPPETRQDFQSGESHVDDISLAEEGESGLAFVAHWIETIINQLQVQINTLVLNLSNESNGIELELKASNIHFHNGDFKEFSEGGVSSSQFASSLMRDSLLKSRFFCKSKKTINVDKVRVAARKRNDCRESEVLRCDPFKIFILSEKNKKDNLVLTDFDVKFSSGTIWFDAEALGLIIQFFTSFKPDEIDTTHAHVDSRTTQTMEGEMDHNDVLISEEIEKLYLEPTSIPHLPSMEEVVESDGEFPDGNDTEEDFFDAVSHVQMNTTFYRTARPLSINERLSKKEPALKFRVYCCALTVHVVNESKEALVLKFNDFIVMKSDEAENINLLKISVNQVFVNLIRKNEEIDIVKFLPEEDNGNTIFSSPDLIIEINLITVEVAILLKSFEVFIDLECFKNWMNWTKLINTSLKKTGGQSKSSSSLSLQTKFCRFYLNCLTSNAEVDVNDFISISLGSKFWDQGSCTLRVRQAMGFFIDMEGLKLIVNDDTRDLTCSLETPHLSAGAFSISTPGSVKIAMVLQCFAASLTPLITLRESQFDSKTYIILSASKIEIALHKVYFAVINWLVSALIFARPSHQADSAGQTSFEARITEFLIFLGNHDQFNLLNLQLFNSDYNDIVKGFSKDALNIRWGPDLVIDGNDLCLRAVVSQNKTQVEASSKHLRAKESIGPSHEKFHDFLQAKSEKSDSIAIYVTLNQADTQSLLSSDSNVRIVLSDSQFYLNCSSQLLLILSEFSPLKAQDMLDRFYYELKQSCDCDLKHSLNVVVSKGKVAGNLCEMESGKVCIDALKVYVELSNFHLFLLDNSMTGSSKIHAQRFTVLVTQLSNSKAFSLKCSSENVAISHQTNELKNFELLKVDFFSILINSLDDGGKSGKEWIEAKFGNLEGRNSVKDLLLIQDYLQSFISNYSKTVAEVILTRKSFEISSKGEPDAWSELFAGDQVDEASSFRNKVASPSPQINSYITEENDEPSVNESVLGSLWEADYGSYGEPLSEPVNNPIECIPLRDKETDSILDALTNSLTDDYPNLDFSNNEEIELSSIRAENEILIEKVQPGLTETELAEIEEVDFAWRDDDSVERNDLSSNPLKASKERDQQATWLIDPETVEINNFYLHNENSTKSGINFVHEENLSFGLRISGNCKYTIMDSGVSQFAKENRIALKNPSDHSQSPTKEEIEISFSGVVIELAHFSTSSRTVEELSRTNLISKLQFTVQNLLVTHRTGSRLKNYKVLGSWNNANHPKGSEDLLKMTILGFSSEHLKLEHRVKIILSPVRCHLTEQFISFIKDKIVTTISDHFQSSDSDVQPVIFFQHIFVASMEIKIDYHANNVNIKALHEGDYIQLLNIFPLEGLELHLKTIRLLGVNGISSLVDSILQVWVTDIYKNQLHRVLTGTVPFRSLSRIGSSLKGLLFIPLRDNQRNPKVWKQLVKGTKSLLSTVTTEALSISHQLSLFVANTISDIASERNYSEITTNQPRNLREGFDRAVHSFSNELSSSIEHVIAVPIRQYQRNGSTGAMTSVIRALPVALLRPVAGVAHGLSYTILGLRNSLNPMQAMDEEDLWESVEQQNP